MPETEIAIWTDIQCPKCGAYFVAKDKWGLFCAVSGCDWTNEKEATDVGRRND